MAAISLLMISQKLEDDIHDENSIKAKCVKRLFEKSFKKARQDYPSVYSRMLSDFKEFNRGEETNASVFELAEAFSDIMKNALNSMFQCTDAELMIIDYVAQWLYFIDAVDDLDEDITKGRFNPFTFMAKSKRQLITERKAYIEGFVDSLRDKLRAISAVYSVTDDNSSLIVSILLNSLPYVSYCVFSNKPISVSRSVIKILQRKGLHYA